MPAAYIPFRLIVITDTDGWRLAQVERALSAELSGKLAIQLRDKQVSTPRLLQAAHELSALTRRRGATLLINHRLDVAAHVNAGGVQLPEDSHTPAAARSLLGPEAWIGVSRHDIPGLQRDERHADFACVSPIHALPGKAPPLGVAGFGRLAQSVRLPVFALGGVRACDVLALRSAGAAGIAVIREVLDAPTPAAKVDELLTLLDG